MKRTKKNSRVAKVELSEVEFDQLVELAEHRGQSISELMRQALRSHITVLLTGERAKADA